MLIYYNMYSTYIYIYRERERDGVSLSMYIYIYIYELFYISQPSRRPRQTGSRLGELAPERPAQALILLLMLLIVLVLVLVLT